MIEQLVRHLVRARHNAKKSWRCEEGGSATYNSKHMHASLSRFAGSSFIEARVRTIHSSDQIFSPVQLIFWLQKNHF
jgi:hypothetical protein